MSFSAIQAPLVSLASIAGATIALASGAIVAVAVTILLCKVHRRLEKRIYPESSTSEDGKSSAHVPSELEEVAARIAVFGYAICCAIAFPASDTAVAAAVEASVMVIGIGIGLAATVLILMVLLKVADCLLSHEQQSRAPQDRKDDKRQ